jgi:hypothetical protein
MYLSYTYTPTASNNHTAPNLKSTLFVGAEGEGYPKKILAGMAMRSDVKAPETVVFSFELSVNLVCQGGRTARTGL